MRRVLIITTVWDGTTPTGVATSVVEYGSNAEAQAAVKAINDRHRADDERPGAYTISAQLIP